ncbi:MAG: AraC family transcriptional regulator [Ignavibacteriota bacterium]
MIERVRVAAVGEQEVAPLTSPGQAGSPSPSPSLLVERLDLGPSAWEFRVASRQILVLFLKAATIGHVAGDGCVRELRVAPGQVAIWYRDERYCRRQAEIASILCVTVGESALDEAARALARHGRSKGGISPLPEDVRIRNLLYALEEERANGYPAGRLFLDSVEAALAALLVSCPMVIRPSQGRQQGGLPPKRIGQVLEFMRANMAGAVTVRELAASAGVSTAHFSRQFRASMGTSPHQYLLLLRIEESKRMLQEADASILDIAMHVGFESQQHFATVFRRFTGVCPSDYRDRR